MPDKAKIAAIRDQLNAIAPLPASGPVPAVTLARHMAVAAQERWTRQHAGNGIDRDQIVILCTEFAAAVALYALAATEHRGTELPLGIEPAVPEVMRDMKPGDVAGFIRNCWDDGGSVGEFLWEFLGRETAEEVARLAAEMAEAAAGDDAASPAEAVATSG